MENKKVLKLKKDIEECLPERYPIGQYVDRKDVGGLAEYFRATIDDIRMVLMNESYERTCCDDCYHINMAHTTSKNYCKNRNCNCHKNN